MRRTLSILAGAAALLAAFAAPAEAAGSGSIDHVEAHHGVMRALFSIRGASSQVSPDLASVQATVNGKPVDATATLASRASNAVVRTSVLVLDVSRSMAGKPFDEAKAAAQAYVSQAPADVKIGLVTFAADVTTVQQPTADRSALRDALGGLQLSRQTRLYDGVRAGLKAAGHEGQRSLLVLSDGRDTTGAPVTSLLTAAKKSGDRVDVVSLGQTGPAEALLSRIARAGRGTLVSAADPQALTKLFTAEADVLAGQVLVTFRIPPPEAGKGASLDVSVEADGATYQDSAYVTLGTAPKAEAPAKISHPQPPAGPRFEISKRLMLIGIGSLGLGLMLLVTLLLGGFKTKKEITLDDRLAAYGHRGSRHAKAVDAVHSATPSSATLKDSAVHAAEKALSGGRLEVKVANKLEAAGISFRPAEWLLLHAGIAVAAGFIGFLLSSGGILLTALFLVMGGVLPWIYLSFKAARRIKAFNGQLAETLQVMSGGLSAGLSLAQSVDTVVREGTEPIAGEFRRALIEARLGVNIEDALEGIAKRMGSKDFEWVVMAVRIQREVGGNLAELLLTVSATLREREYLRRQVLTLSAEGRLSAYILGGLPPVFMIYLTLTQRAYVSPMFHSPIGWVMLGMGGVMMVAGGFWLKKTVKVEV